MILNAYQIEAECTEKNLVEFWKPEALNAASLDVHLGQFILVETLPEKTKFSGLPEVVSLRQRERLCMTQIDLKQAGHFLLRPGQFILAQTIEKFNLPTNISAEYKLKSSMARIGLEHLNAGWCDAGWNGSVLTLELRNLTTYHEIELVYGDRIGQVIFYKHTPVESKDSYAAKGSYNGLDSVSGPIASRQSQQADSTQDAGSRT